MIVTFKGIYILFTTESELFYFHFGNSNVQTNDFLIRFSSCF